MELFEVSAKDNTGEFGSVVQACMIDLISQAFSPSSTI
jgi:hypothetical protein